MWKTIFDAVKTTGTLIFERFPGWATALFVCFMACYIYFMFIKEPKEQTRTAYSEIVDRAWAASLLYFFLMSVVCVLMMIGISYLVMMLLFPFMIGFK